MRKTEEETLEIKQQKIMLGAMIKAIRTDDNRGYISMRKLANAVKIPASNMKYIEDGINAPAPEVYEAILKELDITDAEREELDVLYSGIRGTPPPDVCKIVCANSGLNDTLRAIGTRVLTAEQLSEITALITSFTKNTTEGAATNG